MISDATNEYIWIVETTANDCIHKIISDIIYACIILHNMIVKEEGYAITKWPGDEGEEVKAPRHGHT
ncbi:putative harbinger transposase-derived protein [Helianthus anomalus]